MWNIVQYHVCMHVYVCVCVCREIIIIDKTSASYLTVTRFAYEIYMLLHSEYTNVNKGKIPYSRRRLYITGAYLFG